MSQFSKLPTDTRVSILMQAVSMVTRTNDTNAGKVTGQRSLAIVITATVVHDTLIDDLHFDT
jgi:hypothetical protein